ncbi:MAG: LLM class flavin-dependent oxidoreductase [Chloroflexi bacterium]|nr:LLM class flavin-dependent oxidoreductase [Chloroflexota bacterium]
MTEKLVGISVAAPSASETLANIREAESLGVKAAWMTSGGDAGDSLSILAAAAAQTDSIMLGTSIMQTWSRHPVTTARQAATIANLAPGRFRLGVGPGHRQGMQQTFGTDFEAPLTHLREYLQVLKALLHGGSVEFKGSRITAAATMPEPVDVPVFASALRSRSYEICGEVADGAISWVCPHFYVRDVALPALRKGAEAAGRQTPSLIVHAPVCVDEDLEAARDGVRQQLGYFPRTPFYARMFASAGFPSSETDGWTNEILDAVLISGDEAAVADRLNAIFHWGATEVLASVVMANGSRDSYLRTLKFLGEYSPS